MAGLMDILGSDTGLLGLQLMAAGSAKPVRTGFGEGLLGALQSVQAQRAAEKDRAMKEQMQLAQLGLIGAQTEETKAQAAARLAAGEEARKKAEQLAQQQAQAMERMRAFQGALGGPTSPQQALADGGGPTPANAARIGQVQAPNWQALALQFPDQIELIKKLSESGNFGRQEVGRVEETMVDGRPVRQQFDKFGAPIGAALPQWKAPVMSDTGGAINAIDPVTLQVLKQLTKTNTPDALLSAQTTMRGQNLTDARAREGNSLTGQMNALKLEELKGKVAAEKQGKEGALASYETAVKTLDRLASHPGLSAAVGAKNPFAGSFGFYTLPGTQAANFNAELEAFKSQTFLPMVQSLRGMGALSDAEGKKLSAAVGALDPSMSEDEFKASAGRIRADLEGAFARVSGGQQLPATAGGGGPAAGATVVRTGRDAQGRKVEQMSDGSIRYGKD